MNESVPIRPILRHIHPVSLTIGYDSDENNK